MNISFFPLLFFFSVTFSQPLAQKYPVLLRGDEERPIILYSDPISSHPEIIVHPEISKESFPIFLVEEVLPCHFKGTLWVNCDNDTVSYNGYIEKTSCYGYIYPDYYSVDSESRVPFFRLYSEPDLNATYSEYLIDAGITIEAVPLDFVYSEGKAFIKVIFMYDNHLQEGYVTRLCTQGYTTCN